MDLSKRVLSLDTLRGFAILLMVIDHFFAITLMESITFLSGRFFTRLSEPLFAILFGYFLYNRNKKRMLYRAFEVFIVFIIINIFFFYVVGKFEILGTFLIIYALYYFFSDKIIYALPSLVLFNLDPTIKFLDYPFTLVLSQVSLGMIIRSKNVAQWIPLLLLFAVMYFFMPLPYAYTSVFTIPAALLMYVALKKKDVAIPGLVEMGQNPLASYVIQYYVVVFITVVLSYLGLIPSLSY